MQASNGKYVIVEDNFSPYPFRLVATFAWSTPYNYPHDETFAFIPPDQPPGMLRSRTPFNQRGAWENFIWRRVSTSCV